MTFSSDERVLAILYGDGTREGLKDGLSRLRDECGREDRHLKRMAERLLAKMETMTDGDIRELSEVP